MADHVTESEAAAFDLLSRMRFACGDNGKRMQDELEEYLRELKRDAERYRWLREGLSATDIRAIAYEREIDPGRGETAYNIEVDRAIDAAMNGSNA